VDTKQFVASLVSSLAWPVAVVVILLLFREQLRKLLDTPLKRLKAGPSGVELEFDRIISEAAAQVEPLPQLEPARESATADLADVAALSPAAAVLDGFTRVEEKLRTRLRDAGDQRADEQRGAMALTRYAGQKQLISPETVEAIRGLAVLRNLAAHGGATDVTPDRAAEFLALVDAVIFAIEQGSE
jgi:hypothetical protein